MAHYFLISSGQLSNGRTAYYAQLAHSDEPRFVIGYRTLFEGNVGLFNTTTEEGAVFTSKVYAKNHGFWSYFIYPTAKAESHGSFFCLNTYDRARFTFGFMQFAAHVPNGDFVVFLRGLMEFADAGEYFPNLALDGGRICYRNQGGALSRLESDTSTDGLMDYLNPGLSEIENQELVCSARLVHWAKHAQGHRDAQVETAVKIFQQRMTHLDKRFNLDGVPADVCQVICDIRHQGRGTNDRIAAALNTHGDYGKSFQNLLTIGAANYSVRIRSIRDTIAELKREGVFNKKYNRKTNEFDAV